MTRYIRNYVLTAFQEEESKAYFQLIKNSLVER